MPLGIGEKNREKQRVHSEHRMADPNGCEKKACKVYSEFKMKSDPSDTDVIEAGNNRLTQARQIRIK